MAYRSRLLISSLVAAVLSVVVTLVVTLLLSGGNLSDRSPTGQLPSRQVASAPPEAPDIPACDLSRPATDVSFSSRTYETSQSLFYGTKVCLGEARHVWFVLAPQGTDTYLCLFGGPVYERSDLSDAAFAIGLSGRIRIQKGMIPPGTYDAILLTTYGFSTGAMLRGEPDYPEQTAMMPAPHSGVQVLFQQPVVIAA
jgi:hypothetical protein